MLFSKTAILTDLDGTLFNSRGEVSRADRTAIAAYVTQGGIFAIASGREAHNARRHLPGIPLNGPSIVLNGAAIYDFQKEEYRSLQTLDLEAAAAVTKQCLRSELPLDIQIYTDEGIFYVTPLETANPGFLEIHQPTSYLPLSSLKAKRWVKVVCLERIPGTLATMRGFLREQGFDRRLNLVEGRTDVVEAGNYQELLPLNINKGTCMDQLRLLPEYEGRVLFAVGDYWNDMELLQAADVACAPENAIEEIKEVCQYVLPSHNDAPMAHLIFSVIAK